MYLAVVSKDRICWHSMVWQQEPRYMNVRLSASHSADEQAWM